MFIKVYLKNEGGLRTAFVKLSRHEAAPAEDAIELTLYRKYDRIPFVVFTEGSYDFTWKGSVIGNIRDVIISIKDSEYQAIELER